VSASAPRRPGIQKANKSRSSVKTSGNFARRYVPAGGLFPNPDRRRPGFTCCKAWRSVRIVVEDFVSRRRKITPPITGRIRTCAATTTAHTQVRVFMPTTWMNRSQL